MTPSELLVAAADRIDQAAQAAGGEAIADGLANWFDADLMTGDFAPADAVWIALLNPQTGEHIAALLRKQAQIFQWFNECDDDALALARAVLGHDGGDP